MPDLIAQGSQSNQRWRRPLPEGTPVVIGRSEGNWTVEWDPQISRRHAEICWQDDQLDVRQLESARNPVFVRGRGRAHFKVSTGDHFVIGNTTFTVSAENVDVSLNVPRPLAEQTFAHADLHRARFRDVDQRIEALARLPEIIAGAGSDTELCVRLVNTLLAGIPACSAVAVVRVGSQADNEVEVLHWDRRLESGEKFSPSARLIRQAVRSEESVAHVWRELSSGDRSFTHSENADWAFCTPVVGSGCPGWGIYVTGIQPTAPAAGDSPETHWLMDDVKFTEICASTLNNVRLTRLLERKQAGLRPFFSPIVLDALAGQDPEDVLRPKQADVSVLFCDLRGFSQRSEQDAGDLMGLLQRVSEALGVMTHEILSVGGVVGDFHGDAAMGFWGWPIQHPDAAERSCRAALGVRREFEAASHSRGSLSGFQVGIGIASGTAVAGRIGTVDQVKVTVFGPVVNLASRLEGLTRKFRAPILIDEPTAKAIRTHICPHTARLRRVARLRPYGMTQTVDVFELLPPATVFPELLDEHLEAYEEAVTALIDGDWDGAFQLLHQVPATDRVKDFLTVYIAQRNRTPPADWDGVITMESK